MRTEHSILIVGAGGHARVVVDALAAGGVARGDVVVCDDRATMHGCDFLGAPILVPAEGLAPRFHVAIGHAGVRMAKFEALMAGGMAPLTVIHPHASVSGWSRIAPGCFVAARAVVAPNADLRAGVIVNHGAVIDHDVRVGEFSHIAPNATLAGGVTIGARTLVGAGANILPGVHIGDDCTVGAGAVVISNVPSGTTWIGIPAAPLQRATR